MRKALFLSLLFLCCYSYTYSQVYKTPSGDKYHLQSCYMVENVSQNVSIKTAITEYGLEPCKICKPPIDNSFSSALSGSNKSVGENYKTHQCSGTTQRGTQCKHQTRIGNTYCYQHHPKNSTNKKSSGYSTSSSYKSAYNPSTSSSSHPCGARTASGASCKRKVKGYGKCYQHK